MIRYTVKECSSECREYLRGYYTEEQIKHLDGCIIKEIEDSLVEDAKYRKYSLIGVVSFFGILLLLCYFFN